MDVHPPHEPIHSWRDFLLHLVTITIGLLIAVGIEGCVELHHERNLVRESRAALREEIAYNSGELSGELVAIQQELKSMQGNLDYLWNVQQHPADPAAQHGSLTARFANVTLRDAAWRTAQNTGAFAWMPHAEAQQFADIYQAQSDFVAAQEKIVEDEAQFMGVGARTGLFAPNDKKAMSPESAALMLQAFGVWEGHLTIVDILSKVCDAQYQGYLRHKPVPKDFNENLNLK